MAAHGRGGAMPDIPTYNSMRTLVFLMVAKRVTAIANDCLARGYPSSLPAAVIERAATPSMVCFICVCLIWFFYVYFVLLFEL